MSKKGWIIFGMLALSGCAKLFEGSSQNITIATMNDTLPDKTRCKMTNEEGSWAAIPNVAANIHRDGNNLDIDCDNDNQSGEAHIEPRFQGAYLGLNLLVDLCIISCWVDGISNSFYEYPTFIPVQMKTKGGQKGGVTNRLAPQGLTNKDQDDHGALSESPQSVEVGQTE